MCKRLCLNACSCARLSTYPRARAYVYTYLCVDAFLMSVCIYRLSFFRLSLCRHVCLPVRVRRPISVHQCVCMSE